MHLRLHLFFTITVFCLLKTTPSETATANGSKIRTTITKRSAVDECKLVYSWKPFDGTIPEDAFIGATNFGSSVYIGRGPVAVDGMLEKDYGLFIGPITKGSFSISLATEDKIYTITDSLEILTSNKPCDFRWVSTNSTSVLSLPGLIKAGYYSQTLTFNFYVGRIKLREREYAIGHVNQRSNFVLFYINRTVHSSSSTFEILTY